MELLVVATMAKATNCTIKEMPKQQRWFPSLMQLIAQLASSYYSYIIIL